MVYTYPHSDISSKCREKYDCSWDILECVVNSLQIYYEKIDKKTVKKYVLV
jgi:hypothetical protein